MDDNNIQYYMYEDQSNSESTMIVEENKLLKQLQEAGKFSKCFQKYIKLNKNFI